MKQKIKKIEEWGSATIFLTIFDNKRKFTWK